MSATADQRPETSNAPQDAGDLPLFYRRPEVLTPQAHGRVRLRREDSYRFAAQALCIPLMGSEFVHAMRSYPIVFATDTNVPVAVTGLERGNLFVRGDGKWTEGHYVPAYLRRYPFVLVSGPDGKEFVLGIDTASDRVITEGPELADAQPLFNGDAPSELTREVLSFCGAYQRDYDLTTAFCNALAEQGLLIDNQAKALLPDGRSFNLKGFRVVDQARLMALSDAVVGEWFRKGWLTLVTFHLLSLERMNSLMQLRATRG